MTENIVPENSENWDKSKLPKHLMRDGTKWLMIPSKTLLAGVAVWPETQNNLTKALNFGYFAFYLFIFWGQFHNITGENSNLGSMSYTMFVIIIVIETIARRSLCYFYRKRLTKILSKVYFEFWPSNIAGNDLHQELSRYSWYLFLFTSGYTLSATISGLQINIVPYFKRNLPYFTTYPFPWNESPWYELLYITQSFAMIELVFNICGLDLFFVSLLCNCVAQFKLLRGFLQKEFEEILKKTEDNVDKNIRRTEIRKLLLVCIQHHVRLIKVCRELEETFTYFVLVQYLASIGTVCVSTFVGVVVKENVGAAFTYLMGHTCEILIYCYMGNELINESTKLSDTVFYCGWHQMEYDKSLQKSLMMIMVRAQNSIQISVGGFGVLSLPGFFSLMKFSFSIYALLNSLMLESTENI